MRRLFLIVASILFLLGACSKKTEENNEQPLNNNEENISAENLEENNQITNENEAEEDFTGNNDEEDLAIEEEPQYKVNEVWSIVPIDDTADENVVLLTIDDAPEHYSLEMARKLHELEAPAIFFVNGHFLQTEEQKEVLKEIYDLGFVIGNHTYGHKNLSEISDEEVREEVVSVNDMVEEMISERPVFFRAPFGIYSDYARQVLKEENMTFMNWTYGYDWEADYMTKEAIADIMVNTEYLRAGSNLLMHDRKWTAEALEDIVNGLREKGYGFVDPLLIETN